MNFTKNKQKRTDATFQKKNQLNLDFENCFRLTQPHLAIPHSQIQNKLLTLNKLQHGQSTLRKTLTFY